MSEERPGEEMVKAAKEFVKSTIKFSRRLWEEGQIYAIRSGLTFTDVVNAALKRYLDIIQEQRASRKGAKRKVEKALR